MELKELIAERWLDRVLSTYPGQTAVFLASEKDPFRNPVGHTFRRSLAALSEELLGRMDRSHIVKALDSIMQVGAVQDMPASGAIDFLLQVKPLLAKFHADLSTEMLNGRIDEMLAIAIDSYVKHRERIFQARANETRRRVFVLERRFGMREESCTS